MGPAHSNRKLVGWREWVRLGDLDLPPLKAKIDTGARTSALHAFELATFVESGQKWVRFSIHPYQNKNVIRTCAAPILDRRSVSDSGGHRYLRYIIQSDLTLGDQTWPIELSLAGRETMRFRLLLGRTALQHRFVIDPALSYCFGKKPKPID
jgi:hypothetical protein